MSSATKSTRRLSVNGVERTISGGGAQTLLTALREEIGLTGTKRGCNQGVCGACTVLIDSEPVRACLTLTANCGDRPILTIEGLAKNGELAPVQQALIDGNAVQCGFCISGMVLSAHSLLENDPSPDVEAVRAALSGNICRCSGYKKIVTAVLAAAKGRGT